MSDTHSPDTPSQAASAPDAPASEPSAPSALSASPSVAAEPAVAANPSVAPSPDARAGEAPVQFERPDQDPATPLTPGTRRYYGEDYSQGVLIPLRPVRITRPFVWLIQGVRDYVRTPVVSLFYGVLFCLMGWALMHVYEEAPAYVLALSAGWLLIGPFMCLGIYHATRCIGLGQKPDLGQSLLAWEPKLSYVAIFGVVLMVLEMLWARSVLVLFALSFDGVPDFKGSILALFNPENVEFTIGYFSLGGVFGALIFAFCVVSMPMILDRETDAVTAALTSFRLCLNQPLVMLVWGLLIAGLVFLSILPYFAGLLFIGPVLGHASWHAYKESVGGDDRG